MGTRQLVLEVGRRRGPGTAALLLWASWSFGCLPPPHMKLSAGIDRGGKAGVWWYLPGSASLRGPLVGIEQRVSGTDVRQWLIDDRGLRCFDYRGKRAGRWGPPLSAQALGDDFCLVPSLVRARFGAEDEPGWPGPPLPPDEAARLHGSADLLALLRRHWAAAQTDPPPGLTARQVEQAMEASRVTILDLLKSDM